MHMSRVMALPNFANKIASSIISAGLTLSAVDQNGLHYAVAAIREGNNMTMTGAVETIFEDATQLHRSALERLEAGDIRDAAEKAWCAAKRATDALNLAWTGVEPEKTPMTTRGLNELVRQDGRVDILIRRYYTRMGSLHGECFYLGLCDPIETTERRIRETDQYIEDARILSGN